MSRKLSTVLEKVSYRRIESIIGVSYKVLIRYDEGTSVSEENLKIITETINRVETDPEYKVLFYEKPKKAEKKQSLEESRKEKNELKETISQLGQQIAQMGTGNESENEKTIKVQNAGVYGSMENAEFKMEDTEIRSEEFVKQLSDNHHSPMKAKSIENQDEFGFPVKQDPDIQNVLIQLVNSCLDAVHSLNEQLTECMELMVEVTQSIPFEEMITMDNRLKKLEEIDSKLQVIEDAMVPIGTIALSQKMASVPNIVTQQNPLPAKPSVTIQHVTPQPAPVQLQSTEQRPFINSSSSNLLLSDDILDLLPS